MVFKFGASLAILAFTTGAFASEIFVKEARGNLTQKQRAEITGLVKNAVRGMSEHALVGSANSADFVLQPSVITRGDELVLRVEKQKGNEIVAMSEESISSVNASKDRAMAVTETALSDVNYGRSYRTDDDGATESAMTSGADDSATDTPSEASTESSQGAVDVTRKEVGRKADNASTYQTTGVDSTAKSPGADASVGELTSASPRMTDPDRIGQVQIGVGPSFGINMKDDSLMYDLNIAYGASLNENFAGKVFGDFNFAAGSSTSRFINLGLAGEYYPSRELLTFGKPYVGANLGYSFVRDGLNRTGDGLAGGLAAGFKFQASQLNWDVAANYTILFNQIADETPNVFGVRVALGF